MVECNKCNYKYYTISKGWSNRELYFEIQRCKECGKVRNVGISKEQYEKLKKERRTLNENRPK